jgi:hypothetical protein
MRSGIYFSATLIVVLGASAQAYDWTTNPGDGSPENPYQIAAPEHLMAIGDNAALLDKHFILTNDIIFDPNNNPAHVFTQALIAPYLGTGSPAFTGFFDGNDHQIVNLKIVSDGGWGFGLFGLISGADPEQLVLRDLTLVNPLISGSGSLCGPLVGTMEGCKIEACYVIGGTVNAPDARSVGGLAGSIECAKAGNCFSSAQVFGFHNVGGLAGVVGASVVFDCAAAGEVTGSSNVGGLVGGADNAQLISLSADYSDVGFHRCFASGNVHGQSGIGGLIGLYSGDLSNNSIALLVKDCYARGNVSSAGVNVGGLIGFNRSLVVRCYATGQVTGADPSLGLIGGNYGGEAYLSFWDIESSQQSQSAGGTGKTTAQMMSPETYRGWGDGIWVLEAGVDYPHLAWENTPGGLIVDIREYAGNGTAQDPYQLRTAEDLIALGWYVQDWDKRFELMNDIELDPANLSNTNVLRPHANFNMIGLNEFPFRGYVNGNFHGISNPENQNINEKCNGVFGFIRGSGPDAIVLENIMILNPVFSGWQSLGGLAGRLENGKIVRCGVDNFMFSGLIEEMHFGNFLSLGGLIGVAKNATISMSYAEGEFNLAAVNDYSQQGGLVGDLSDSEIENSCAGAVVSRKGNVSGGFVGYSFNNTFENCYAMPTYADQPWNSIYGFVHESVLSSYIACYYRNDNNIDSSHDVPMLSDVQMKQQASFNGWDFLGESANGVNETWRMCVDGVDYPRLSWEFARGGDVACGDGVDLVDLAALAAHWLTSAQLEPAAFNHAADANGDEQIDLADFAILSENWPGPATDE